MPEPVKVSDSSPSRAPTNPKCWKVWEDTAMVLTGVLIKYNPTNELTSSGDWNSKAVTQMVSKSLTDKELSLNLTETAQCPSLRLPSFVGWCTIIRLYCIVLMFWQAALLRLKFSVTPSKTEAIFNCRALALTEICYLLMVIWCPI
ncbi:hypothetical protein KIL84_003921 [Mauremys mutica]|uniref:Uncharacterized protein n=1 Tax=Mauremys mutica TaxID=74926 RepID=A0A9D3WXC0_9SAUR|nr:hypothetical protein KIL84_003921 [Mauremys mutica]